jgi:ABC-type cobalamin/Fe3+-siderophores transport system ATPase subunit
MHVSTTLAIDGKQKLGPQGTILSIPMTPKLTRFRIEGLHGAHTDIDIPIEDNCLILVGENGTGKSTVANMLYYCLTQQWERLAEYRFSSVQVSAEGETVTLRHEDITRLAEGQDGIISRRLLGHYPSSAVRRALAVLEDEAFARSNFDSPRRMIERLSDVAGIPTELAQHLIFDLHTAGTEKVKKAVLQDLAKLESWAFGQFLYLPTYRRIEQDLKSIFRGIKIEENLQEYRDRIRKRKSSTFIELIEFGMQDVERTLQLRMAQTKENVRTGLSTLTGTYLREVIRGLQDNPDISVLRSIDPTGFQSMFARIDEAILPSEDKKLLQAKIAQIAEGYTLGPDDRVIAHFLSKLVALYNQQQDNESDVRDFVRLCNAYLSGKQFVYDDLKYEIYITQTSRDSGVKKEGERLELKALSSGEKQIVSLFSHIYLSGEKRVFVVIDEPELSLSVPWQQRFLPDVMKTGRCTGIIAVTHSPFIWENDLEKYVKSLAEFIRPHVEVQ